MHGPSKRSYFAPERKCIILNTRHLCNVNSLTHIPKQIITSFWVDNPTKITKLKKKKNCYRIQQSVYQYGPPFWSRDKHHLPEVNIGHSVDCLDYVLTGISSTGALESPRRRRL